MAQLRQFTRDEVANSDSKLTKFILHDKVYDVTEFLNEHPGGEEILLEHKGADASEDFDDVGHSSDAHKLMEKYLIGEVTPEEKRNIHPKKGWIAGQSNSVKNDKDSTLLFYLWAGGIIAFIVGSLLLQWS